MTNTRRDETKGVVDRINGILQNFSKRIDFCRILLILAKEP